MTVIGWTLYACLINGHGVDCHERYHLSTKEVCGQAAEIVKETGWKAYCLPIMREK